MDKEEIKKLARLIAEENYNCTGNEKGITLMAMEYESVLNRIAKDFYVVSKDFINRQRLIIEFDKKTMLEKPIGEKMALAGVYQAKLELMDKLFEQKEE